MLIKFFRNGQGGGSGPVDYLVERDVVAYDQNRNAIRDERGDVMLFAREPLPEVLRGDADRMRALIDACPHQWTYRAGVIAFTAEDAPSPAQQRQVMDAFENLAFAGLEADQRDMLWVRHTHEGRVELHFVTPRMELASGRSLNIAPPGYQKHYDALRDVLNKEHGWNDPMAPERARETVSLIESVRRGDARELIHDWIVQRIETGGICDRPNMTEALTAAGFDLPRTGKNYITVRDPETDERWRLKGDLFREDWTRENTLERALERSSGEPSRSGSRLDAIAPDELRDRLERSLEARASYNRDRYPQLHGREPTALERGTDDDRGGREPASVDGAAVLPDHGRGGHSDHPVELHRELVLGGSDDRPRPERQPLAIGLAEGKALAEAARQQAGTHLVVDPSLSVEEQREQLYRNAAEFAASTGAQYGVALTEAQRAALEKPIVWHETRIIDGKPVLVPRLYLPSQDELLRGGRGAGLIAADDLLIDIDGKLNNSGAMVASGLASISASSILNQRLIDLDERDRALAGGRGDSGLISAGTLFMATDGDLLNRGGTLASAGNIDLRVGGSLINETERYTRTVDSQDGCVGKACGTLRTDYNVASISARRDLTVIADRDIVNSGGTLGSVTDMLLAAGRDVTFETLKDSFVAEDYKKRGFLSGITVLRNEITTAEASAQSLVGGVSILAGYGVCDGGSLCAKGTAPGDVLLNGALVSAFDKLSIDATGKIDMGVVSEEVHNRYKEWGFKGLGWGSVKQAWNDVDTTVTRLSGNDVSLNAKGPITGTGVKIAAVNDLLMKTDDTIRLEAAQDALYFTEKGFYVGLSFPGSAGIDAALKGGYGGQILSGLAGINPVTAKLATLANADNGLAAGLAVVNLATTGASVFGGAVDSTLGPNKGGVVGSALDPLKSFRDPGTGQITAGSIAKTVGINLSVWKSEQRWSESQISELTAGGDIVMKAGLDVILDQGTKMVSGGDVSIDAGRDILMAALVDYAKDKSSSFGLQLSLSSIGFDIGKSKGYDETLTNASITAAGNVSLTSGRDTSLLGGNIIGRTVDLDVGRDLTILSPQAQGWRDGFSFGLTVGVNPADWSVRGSKEDGFKAWSSGSGIVAAQGIDIKVAEDTTLIGALLQATDGDISLDTGTLTVADLKDTDQYKNVGGSIGISGGGLNSVGFSYEKKDKQGETRTTLDASGDLNVTIRDADKDGVAGTEADKAAAEQLLASINKDASKYQEITKDDYTKLSGELDVQNLLEFGDNLKKIQNYQRAQNAAIPETVAAQGPEAVDLYRDAIVRGLTGAELQNYVASQEFHDQLVKRNNLSAAIASGEKTKEEISQILYLTAAGEQLFFDKKDNQLKIVTDCGTNGYGSSPCGVPLNELSKLSPDKVQSFIDSSLVTLLQPQTNIDAAIQAALDCAIAWTIQGGSFDAFGYIENYLQTNTSAISVESRYRADASLAVARANAIQIAKAVDAKLIKNLNDESINWGSQLYDVAKIAQADPDSAWGMISTLQYQLLAMGDASDVGGNTWARMIPALNALADSLGMGDAVAAGRDRFQQTSDEERTRVNRGIRAWMAGDGSFEKLPKQDQEAAQNALGMATLGTATGPGAAIGAMIGGAVGKATIWTLGRSQNSVQNAYDHFKNHGNEFNAKNATQYVKMTYEFRDNPPTGSLSKVRLNGDRIVYDPASNTLGIFDKNGAPKTMYKPMPKSASNPRGYDPNKFGSPMDYYNAQ